MPRYTYLEIVNSISQDINGRDKQDIIYTLDQTLESTFIKRVVKETYYSIIDGKDWPHLYKPFLLSARGVGAPTQMTLPSDVMELDYIKYNVRKATDTKDKFLTIERLEPKEFMDITDGRDSSATEVDSTTDDSGITINVFNDRAPKYWTSFDDDIIIFDAYDSAIDTNNLIDGKTQCRGKVYPTVTESDSFVFDLPTEAFTYLLVESKNMSTLLLNKEANPKLEQMSNTQRRRLSAEAHRITNEIKYPNYGRRGKK